MTVFTVDLAACSWAGVVIGSGGSDRHSADASLAGERAGAGRVRAATGQRPPAPSAGTIGGCRGEVALRKGMIRERGGGRRS